MNPTQCSLPATQARTLEMAPGFLWPTQDILGMPQVLWLRPCRCLSHGRGMPGGNLSTTSHLEYLWLQSARTKGRVASFKPKCWCPLPHCPTSPSPPLLHQNKDQQGYQTRLRTTEGCKDFLLPTHFLSATAG